MQPVARRPSGSPSRRSASCSTPSCPAGYVERAAGPGRPAAPAAGPHRPSRRAGRRARRRVRPSLRRARCWRSSRTRRRSPPPAGSWPSMTADPERPRADVVTTSVVAAHGRRRGRVARLLDDRARGPARRDDLDRRAAALGLRRPVRHPARAVPGPRLRRRRAPRPRPGAGASAPPTSRSGRRSTSSPSRAAGRRLRGRVAALVDGGGDRRPRRGPVRLARRVGASLRAGVREAGPAAAAGPGRHLPGRGAGRRPPRRRAWGHLQRRGRRALRHGRRAAVPASGSGDRASSPRSPSRPPGAAPTGWSSTPPRTARGSTPRAGSSVSARAGPGGGTHRPGEFAGPGRGWSRDLRGPR